MHANVTVIHIRIYQVYYGGMVLYCKMVIDHHFFPLSFHCQALEYFYSFKIYRLLLHCAVFPTPCIYSLSSHSRQCATLFSQANTTGQTETAN